MAQLTDREIADLARKLVSILDDNEQGLSSWHIAKARVGRQLYDALGEALGEPMRGVQIGHGNTQHNTF